MKKCLIWLMLTALFLGMLSGCDGTIVIENFEEVSDPTEPDNTEAPEMQETEPVETEPEMTVDEILLAALQGNTPVVTEYNISEPLTAYLAEQYSAAVDMYATVDFDGDGQDEVVALASSMAANYVVLHYDQGNVYAFPFGTRSMMSLSREGHFFGSNGATGNVYMGLSFSGGRYTIEELAKIWDFGESYEVDGQICSRAEYDARVTELNNEEQVSWLPYTDLVYQAFVPGANEVWLLDSGQYKSQFVFDEVGMFWVLVSWGFEPAAGGVGNYTVTGNRLDLELSFDGTTVRNVSYIYVPALNELVQISSTGLIDDHTQDTYSFAISDSLPAERAIELAQEFYAPGVESLE